MILSHLTVVLAGTDNIQNPGTSVYYVLLH